MIKQKFVFIFLGVFSICIVYGQEYNKLDKNGQRNGPWQKFYDGSKQLRYQGTFDHGKEIGAFKFYDKKGGHPTAIKLYTAGSELLDVIFYTTSGKKVSEGKMKERSREGKWVYYHQDGINVMAEEVYKNNSIEGERIVYFESGAVAQRVHYKNGKEEGLEYHYTEEGIITKQYTYVKGQLHGLAKLYDIDGVLQKEGNYKENKKHGTWIYYENGKVKKKVKFPQNRIGVED